MLPVVQRTRNTVSNDAFRFQEGWVQRRPIDRTLAYVVHGGTAHHRLNETSAIQSVLFNWDDIQGFGQLAYYTNQAKTLAWGRFISQMGDRANWAINLAELQQAVGMVTGRCLQMADFLRHLRRGDFIGAAATLKVPTPKKVSTKKAFASNYLEFHFGWAPLMNDIFTSVDILQSPIRDIAAVGKGMTVQKRNTMSQNDSIRWVTEHKFYSQYGSLFAVTNPNLYLANQLGLVNPLVVAWELIPFSFVVDWFVNVSQFCAAGSDLFGVTTKMPYTTDYCRGTVYRFRVSTPPHSHVWASHWRVGRESTLAGPTLTLKPQRLWHWRRMAAAASLVVQRFAR